MKSGTQPMELLRLLSMNRHTWVSTADIAGLLFISRLQVRVVIHRLRQEGVAIETKRGYGYRLSRGRESP